MDKLPRIVTDWVYEKIISKGIEVPFYPEYYYVYDNKPDWGHSVISRVKEKHNGKEYWCFATYHSDSKQNAIDSLISMIENQNPVTLQEQIDSYYAEL